MFDQTVQGIRIQESENPVSLSDMEAVRGFFFSKKFADKFFVRKKVLQRLAKAQKNLPAGYRFLIYEAFRSRQRQIELWDALMLLLRDRYPTWTTQQYEEEGGHLIANPYGTGSGHQAGAAVDITLCSDKGEEFDMGTEVQEFTAATRSDYPDLPKDIKERREILRSSLESAGLINYPKEWWHFSYGDRLWAEVLGRKEAFFAPID